MYNKYNANLHRLIREAAIIFQSGRKKRAYFFKSLETFNIIELNLKRTCRRLQNTNFKMQANILRYYFKILANIYKLWQLSKSKPSYQYRSIYNNTQKCIRHSRSIKNIRNPAIYWFLCYCGIIRTLYGLRQTYEYQTRNAGLLERRESILKAKKSGGIIKEAVLLERAALLERIQQVPLYGYQ